MTTATSIRPTRPDTPPPAPRKPSWPARALIIALIACVTAGVFIFAGMFDTTASKNIDIEPVASAPASSPTSVAAPRPADSKVVVNYVAKMKAWNECMKKHPGEAAAKPCGDMPAQIDDPSLNAYLAEVLDWNKCAAPLLKQGALTQAEAACGPQPVPAAGT